MDFDTFWKQFLVECQEHIEIIEEHLLCAEHTPVNTAEIAELFRTFHSIKGLSKSMDLTGIESIAHVCEDILGIIREGKAEFNLDNVDLLLKGVDCIKNLVIQACNLRKNIEAPEDLIILLKELRDKLSPQNNTGAPAQESDAVITDASIEDNKKEDFVPTFTEEKECTNIVVSHDDETVHYFIENIVQTLSQLVTFSVDTQKIPIQNAINTLRHSYVMMGFESMLLGLEDVLYDINAGPIKYFLNLSRIFTDLHQMVLKTGVPLLSPTEQSVLNVEKSILLNNLFFIKNFIYNYMKDGSFCYKKQEICDVALSFGYSFSKVYPSIPAHIFLEIENLLQVIEMYKTIDGMEEALHSFCQMLQDLTEFLQDIQTDSQHLTQRFATEVEKIIDVSLKIPGQNKKTPPVNVTTTLEVPFIETMGIELLSALQKRFKDSGAETLYVLLTYLEADQNVGERFAMFATKECELPFNRSVFIDNQNWYEFLVIYPHSLEQLESALHDIDPKGCFLKLNHEQTQVLRSSIAQGIKHLVANDLILEQLSQTESQIDDIEEPEVKHFAGSSSQTSSVTIPSSVLPNDTIRIPGDVLDKFMNDIGEMVLACSHLNFTISSNSFKTALIELNSHIKSIMEHHHLPKKDMAPIFSCLNELEKTQKSVIESNVMIHSILRYLQESALNLRVIPLESVFKRLPRIVRDVSKQLDKKINLVLEGQEVRIDKSMVETLVDPLIHMLRNSIDHGVETPEIRIANGKNETGLIRISAVQQGNQIRIDIEDDGYGLDPEKIRSKAIQKGLIDENIVLSTDEIHQLIFHPGFSTASVVTEVSGRGVGMDVVKSNVIRVGGSINITSKKGFGTKISLKMPLSAAIQDVLVVKASNQILALPSRFVTEIFEYEKESLMNLKGNPAVLLREHFLPVAHLGFLLGFGKPENEADKITIVVLGDGQLSLGLHVDEVIHRGELYMKDVHDGIVNLPGVGGASILGDGRVVLVLDGEEILFLATKSPSTTYNNLKIVDEIDGAALKKMRSKEVNLMAGIFNQDSDTLHHNSLPNQED